MIKSYEDLVVYQKADEFAHRVYDITESFPESEKFGLVVQLRRAAISVPANIVEGSERRHKKEFIHFLGIAKGSLVEAEYYLKFGKKRHYVSNGDFPEVIEQTSEIGRLLNGLINSLRSK